MIADIVKRVVKDPVSIRIPESDLRKQGAESPKPADSPKPVPEKRFQSIPLKHTFSSKSRTYVRLSSPKPDRRAPLLDVSTQAPETEQSISSSEVYAKVSVTVKAIESKPSRNAARRLKKKLMERNEAAIRG